MQLNIDSIGLQSRSIPLAQIEAAIAKTEKDGKDRYVYAEPEQKAIYSVVFTFLIRKKVPIEFAEDNQEFISYIFSEYLIEPRRKLPPLPVESFEAVEEPTCHIFVALGIRMPLKNLYFHSTTLFLRIVSEKGELIYSGKLVKENSTPLCGFDYGIKIQTLRQAYPSGQIKIEYGTTSHFPELANWTYKHALEAWQMNQPNLLEEKERLEQELQIIKQHYLNLQKENATNVQLLEHQKNLLTVWNNQNASANQFIAKLLEERKSLEEKLEKSEAENKQLQKNLEESDSPRKKPRV